MVGFNAKNKDGLNSIYKCPACSLILREPVQLACGHRQCKTCTTTINGETIECTECHEKITKDRVMPDRGFQNDMKSLSIICSLCEWIGLLKDYEEHLNEKHLNTRCEFCNQQFSSTITLGQHKQNNCTKMSVIRASINNTSSDSIYRNNSFNDHSNAIHHRSASNSPDYFECEIFRRQDNRSSEMEITIGQTFPTSVPVSSNENNNTGLQEIRETVQILAAGLQAVHEDTQHLSVIINEIRRSIDAVMLDTAALNVRQQDQSALIRAVQLNQEILHQDVASLIQKFDDIRHATYDGTLIWKITKVHENMSKAQSESTRSIYSPPFYSSPTGYKMRARLFFNGYGSGLRTHMSLFIVLMRGPNDAILPFPFSFRVIFSLFDQSSQHQHHIDYFSPDIKSASFQRPTFDMNIHSGIQKFIPISNIQQEDNPYVRDDTMFIQIMVDFIHMPESLIPFALSLNPALPLHIRQTMIQEEVERQVPGQ